MIEVKNLTKYYGNFKAVDDLSFEIRDGEITGLLGPNGAGKTTTMRMITGFFPQSSGAVHVGGVSISEDPLAVKKMIGYLPENAPIYNDMIVYDYLKYAAEIHGITDMKRIEETATLCGLNEVMHKNVGELSKGYKQRVGLAHAMIHDPKVLILDEPTSGLDPNQIIEIRNLIKEIGKKKTVILSTHILPEVEATCDRVIIINKGVIVADGKTSELQTKSKSNASITLKIGGASYNDLAGALKSVSGVDGVAKAESKDGLTGAVVSSSSSNDIRPDIFKTIAGKGWIIYEMTTEQNSLERVFRELTIGGNNE